MSTTPTIPTAVANITDPREQLVEMIRCSRSCAYFIEHYCRIFDADAKEWIPFDLWPAQASALQDSMLHKQVLALKARQIGFTWLFVAKALWLDLFHPIQNQLLFSRREEEAWALMGRLTGMYEHLPQFLKVPVVSQNKGYWELANKSVVRAFPTTAGDSYTATYALVDEFDLLDNQQEMLDAVKPTIEHGGEMVIISRSNKRKPQTPFKKMYRAAKAGHNNWHPIFLPWFACPTRTREWYEAEKRDALSSYGSLDSVHQSYPETDVEALMPPTLNKRINPEWLNAVYEEADGLSTAATPKAPAIPGLIIYAAPQPGHAYRGGADPAEGKEHGDDSSLDIIDHESGEQVAHFHGKVEPDVFGDYIVDVARYYNDAPTLVELNNHGHAVINQVRKVRKAGALLIKGLRDKELGWRTTSLSKTMMYDAAAEQIRDCDCIIHNFDTQTQLTMIEAATQSAPEGEHDDCATSFALALLARVRKAGATVLPASLPYGSTNPLPARYTPPAALVNEATARTAPLGVRRITPDTISSASSTRRTPNG